MIKPLLKWVGGKTQILDKILEKMPKIMDDYHEIFLGGGSVLFGVLEQINQNKINVAGKIYAYDINEPLIYLYKNVQSCPADFYIEIKKLVDEFYKIAETSKIINRNPCNIEEAIQSRENYYYWVRKQYNSMTKEDKKGMVGSAMFLFLNKTGFRGMFRVSSNGFNVPFGHYKNPEIINEMHLYAVHELIQPVIFTCCSYSISLCNIIDGCNSGAFVYLDPPYVPEKATSFVGYTEDGFIENDHIALFEYIHLLNEKKIKMVLSNADVEMVCKQFIGDNYTIERILCKRKINSKNPDAKTNEVLILNF